MIANFLQRDEAPLALLHPQRVQLALAEVQADAQQDDGDEVELADEDHEQERVEHRRVDGRAVEAEDGGTLVQRVPPVDRELDDRQVDGPHQCQDRGGAGPARRVLEGVVQGDIAQIQEEEDEDGGEPGVPDPPRAPHRLAPQGTGNQRDGGEDGAGGRGGAPGDLGQGVAPDQGHEAGDGDGGIGEGRHPGGGHVDEDDPVGLALLVVGGRHDEAPIEPDRREHDQGPSDEGQDAVAEALEAERVGESVHGRIRRGCAKPS